jgi:hypothetical protein
VVPVVPVVPVVAEVSVDGVVGTGVVVVVDEEVDVSVEAFSPQAVRVRAAIRASAAAIGVDFIRELLACFVWDVSRGQRHDSASHCLRATLANLWFSLVVCRCRRL